MDIWQLSQVVRKRKWLVLMCAAFAFLLVMMVAQTSVPRYASTARLVVKPPASMTSDREWVDTSFTSLVDELVVSETFLQRVVSQRKTTGTWIDLRNQIQLRKSELGTGFSSVLSITVTGDSPESAQDLCRNLADEFVRFIPEFSAGEFASNRKFLQNLVREAKDRLTRAESQIVAWQEKNRALDLKARASDYLVSVGKLERQQSEYVQKAAGVQGRINDLRAYLQSGGRNVPWSILEQKNPGIAQIQEALALERIKLAKLQETYTDGASVVRQQMALVSRMDAELQRELTAAGNSLLTDRSPELRELDNKIRAIQATIRGLRKSWSLAKTNLEYSRLNREIEMWTKNYEELLSKLYNARIAEQNARREGSVALIETPMPGIPVRGGLRDYKKVIPIALPVCLAFGVLMALFVEYIATGLRVRPRIEEAMDLPVVGVIPQMPKHLMEHWQELRTPASGQPEDEKHELKV